MDLQTIKLLRLEKEALAGIIKLMFSCNSTTNSSNSGQIEAETLEAFIQQVTLKKI
jgi:hypothetical protein